MITSFFSLILGLQIVGLLAALLQVIDHIIFSNFRLDSTILCTSTYITNLSSKKGDWHSVTLFANPIQYIFDVFTSSVNAMVSLGKVLAERSGTTRFKVDILLCTPPLHRSMNLLTWSHPRFLFSKDYSLTPCRIRELVVAVILFTFHSSNARLMIDLTVGDPSGASRYIFSLDKFLSYTSRQTLNSESWWFDFGNTFRQRVYFNPSKIRHER